MAPASDVAAQFAEDHNIPVPAGEPPTNELPVPVDKHDPPALVEKGALAPIEPTDSQGVQMLGMIERLASNPDFDVEKLKELVKLQRDTAREDREELAIRAFNTDFARLQLEMPEVIEKGKIHDKQGEVASTYATFEDILAVLRPVLGRHHFAIRHETSEVDDGKRLKIVGYLVHAAGHSVSSEFISAPDNTGYKNNTQALGSTRAYGRRYTTFDLLNVATRGEDDDGRKAEIPEPPEGYEQWEQDMQSSTHEGIQVLAQAWNNSDERYRDYATKHKKELWSKMRQEAKDATAKIVAAAEGKGREPGEEG